MRAEPFQVAIAQTRLDDLRRRLEAIRWPPIIGTDDWRPGVQQGYLRGLVDYWRDGYDWRAQEARINAWPQFRTEIDGLPIHYMHIRGRGPKPMPLVLTHGWPWTFWDFHRVLGPLSDPQAHGGDPRDAFDLVVPSLPGFGFSTPLPRGVNVSDTADLWQKLMCDVLRYPRFGAQGGDWGAMVSQELGHRHPQSLTGVHLSMPNFLCIAPKELVREAFAPDEQHFFDTMKERARSAKSHLAVQCEDPQTLAFALEDSPVGLAAWLIERRRNWSDCGGDVESVFPRDDLLTTVMLYWLTSSIGSSMRYYFEYAKRRWKPVHARQPVIEPPTAVAVFPQELIFTPRRLAERAANIRRWTLMPRGGHFAPAEQPDLLVEDVRDFFRTLRDA
jgi:pimeloyl-ACP methyl ester carboxylesterase